MQLLLDQDIECPGNITSLNGRSPGEMYRS
jgi:hypothetical protein